MAIRGNKVLLVKHAEAAEHKNDTYGLPAGRIEDGESVQEAAARELLEETGLQTEPQSLIKLPDVWYAEIVRKDGSMPRFSFVVCIATSWRGEVRVTPEATPEWIAVADIGAYKLLPNVKEAVERSVQLVREET